MAAQRPLRPTSAGSTRSILSCTSTSSRKGRDLVSGEDRSQLLKMAQIEVGFPGGDKSDYHRGSFPRTARTPSLSMLRPIM